MNRLEALGYEFEFENECITIYKSKDGLSRIYYNESEAWKETKKKRFTRVSLYACEIEALNELMNDNKEKKILNILKEKKVDLEEIRRKQVEAKNPLPLEKFLESYNAYYCDCPERQLTLEEMTIIVKWLKGE